MTVLSLDAAHASYGDKQVLGPLTIRVAQGEKVALVGHSGAGKSTLLGLLFDKRRHDMALMPQELGLVQTLSVFHNVYMGRLANRSTLYNLANLVRPLRHEVARVRDILAPLDMLDKLWAPAGELSGGQRQRTAVARALNQNAKVLLADEPVSALDGPRAEAIMLTLTQHFETTVIALHDVELALRHCDRIVGIKDGGIALDQPSHRLRADDLRFLYVAPSAAA
ncbi:phosphonate transport system ATP-binding protein [Modicisalibacter ilicicola DSM 19980]|uniref:Phosphonate transport system ATP-binding protein n=1 Tax=Modicisalibacter ilicicola DSM 19980 TaxID=1121942 RepID=A0A1M4ZX72_9GAMM|nr:ATP-binding cassette domain-containing protein [Halomonas ilicicola]SHF22236.1 phosphonate transport system ATP-binding protein [Halomonas ilicicola DSM 19980]